MPHKYAERRKKKKHFHMHILLFVWVSFVLCGGWEMGMKKLRNAIKLKSRDIHNKHTHTGLNDKTI